MISNPHPKYLFNGQIFKPQTVHQINIYPFFLQIPLPPSQFLPFFHFHPSHTHKKMLLRFFKPSSKRKSRLSTTTTTTPSDTPIPTHFICPLDIEKNGNLPARLHAVTILREIAAADPSLAKTDGLIDAVMRLIREPAATKTALIAAHHMIASDEEAASEFAKIGIVAVLLDVLVDAEKGLCEKALAVMDGVLGCEIGRERGVRNALLMPVLAKKMFRVSEVATEFAVSAMWRICRGERECLKEAVQVGAFQKLLLLLQVGCGDGTREKANELLRMLNGVKGRDECIESDDFKYLKRPYSFD